MRFKREVIWNNYSASANEASSAVTIDNGSFFLVYVSVSGATTISLQINTNFGFKTISSITFSGAGEDFFFGWALPTDKIRLVTSAAVTISAEVQYKC